MVVPFFEDELTLIYECTKGETDCLCQMLIQNVSDKISTDNRKDLVYVNFCFRLIGKLYLIENSDISSLIQKSVIQHDIKNNPVINHGRIPCVYGSEECNVCKFSEDCDIAFAESDVDSDIDEAVCLFCV